MEGDSRCGTCRFFHRETKADKTGFCKAVPPTPIIFVEKSRDRGGAPHSRVLGHAWPPMSADDLCGLYQHAMGVIDEFGKG